MSFKRDVPLLETLCLKFVSSPRIGEALTEASLKRAHSILSGKKAVPIKQKLIDYIVAGGRLRDDTLPPEYLDPSFEELRVNGGQVSIKFIKMITARCTSLRVASLTGLLQLTDDCVRELLCNIPGLERLFVDNCRKLTDLSLQLMQEHGTNLKAINVGGDFNITVAGIEKFISGHPGAENFTQLHISGFKLRDDALITIMSRFPKLTVLSIGYSLVTDEGVMDLCERLRGLVELRLHWCGYITDAVLGCLTQQCPALTSLDICGNKKISGQAMHTLVSVRAGSGAGGNGMDGGLAAVQKLDARYTGLAKATAETILDLQPHFQLLY